MPRFTVMIDRNLPRNTISQLPGKIILLNGASSSGKSTLAQALQASLDEPSWHYSIDHLLAANVLPNQIDLGLKLAVPKTPEARVPAGLV